MPYRYAFNGLSFAPILASLWPMLVSVTLANAAAPQIEDGSCTVFANKNYKGRGDIIAAISNGGARLNLKDASQEMDTDKQVSSLACAQYCSIILYDKPNQKGRAKLFSGAVPSLGKDWNDKASSIEIGCAGEAGGAEPPAAPVLYRCEPDVTLIVQYAADFKSMLLLGLGPIPEMLQNTMAASGSEYATPDAAEGAAVTSFFSQRDEAMVSVSGPDAPLKEWQCKAVE
jgi:hypothetical protein